MRRAMACTVITMMGVLALAPVAQADPPKGTIVTAQCSGDRTLQVNIGVPTNASSQVFVTADSGIFAIKRLVDTTPDGQVVFTKDYGIKGFSDDQLTTCTFQGPTSGNTFTLTGFFTPRSR